MRVIPGECIAFTGAGGKTTALFTLARELNGPILVTTTTHFAEDQLEFADKNLQVSTSTPIDRIIEELGEEVVLLRGKLNGVEKVAGIPENKLKELFQAAKKREITFLIEADGSRQLPLKAPADHEPVIPPFVDRVVVLAGLFGVGKPLDSKWVHRVERFASLSGLAYGEQITLSALIEVLKAAEGGKKGIPSGAKRNLILNQADNPELQAQGNRIARHLIEEYDSVIVASLRMVAEAKAPIPADQKMVLGNVFAAHEPIAAVILAAGKAERMGRIKQLLPWKGKPLLWHVIHAAFEGGINKVIVVVGYGGEAVIESLSDLHVQFVFNQDWQKGQSSSVKAGLSALPSRTGGVVFLLADQPQVSPRLIRSIVERHAASLGPIIAPMVDGRRGNPVLFDRSTFDSLMSIQGDKGGREIFSLYPVQWIEWHDPNALLDIDTEADYKRLVNGEFT